MATVAIGFITQLADGTWTQVRTDKADAEKLAASLGLPVRRGFVALPVLVDVPDVPPRPAVTLADGTRIVYMPNRTAYRVNGADYATIIDVVRTFPVLPADIDAIQALPAETAAWQALAGRS